MTLSPSANIDCSKSSKTKSVSVQSKSIVVTGYQGFLGSAIVKHLGAKPFSITGVGVSGSEQVVRSTCSKEYEIELPDTRFDDIIQEIQPVVLVHCAGTADVGASFRDPPGDYRKNVELTAFVLEGLRRYAPECHLVLLSSAAVYGNPRNLPVSEKERCIPISPYGCHKLLSEQLVEEYASEHGLKTAILRVFSAYGNGLKRQVIYDLCRKLHDDTQTTVKLFGSGEESRDFIHADDIAAAVDHVISENLTGSYNLASGVETTIADLANRLRELSGSHSELVFTGESRAGDPHRWQADISKLSATGFKPGTALDVGLKSYLEWFRQT